TISSYDYEPAVRVQTRAHPEGQVLPVDELQPPHQNPIQYLLHCIERGEPIHGPLSVETSRIGQRIVDSALQSAREKRAVRLEQDAKHPFRGLQAALVAHRAIQCMGARQSAALDVGMAVERR